MMNEINRYILLNSENPKFLFNKSENEHKIRLKYEKPDCVQMYYGQISKDNMHGEGFYTQRKPGNTFLFHGLLYMNKCEGYGQLIFGNSTHFEGLFKNDKRFGPGALTYSDESQDIGLWNGSQLMRLAVEICRENVPQLARTLPAKQAILTYRKLVPLPSPSKTYVLYNSTIRNPQSYFFDNIHYDQILYDNFDNNIEVQEVKSLIFDKSESDSSELYRSSSQIATTNIFELEMMDVINSIKGLQSYTADDILLLQEKCDKMTCPFLKTADSEELSTEEKRNSTEIAVTHLLAWNNEDFCVDVLNHTFRHRHHEPKCSFKLDSLLKGRRNEFGFPGIYECACRAFLEACSEGNIEEVLALLSKFHINPDLTDANGNSGIIYAASSDQIVVIKLLVNAGAKPDGMNDEGLTALNICLLRYICVKDDIADWEKAFVNVSNDRNSLSEKISASKLLQQSTEIPKSPELNDIVLSYAAKANLEKKLLQKQVEKMGICITERQNQNSFKYSKELGQCLQPYLFDLCLKIPSNVGNNTAPQKSPLTYEEESNISINQKIQRLSVIENTINMLLQLGVNPNIGEVPISAIILTLYCDSPKILEMMLKANAHYTDLFGEDQLNLLHILCSIPPAENMNHLAKQLLDRNINPDFRCNPTYWNDEQNSIRGVLEIDAEVPEDFGKTPLHILAIRKDYDLDPNCYLSHLAETIVQYAPSTLDDLYLGHTSLGLAVLRGNKHLVKTFLEMNADPNKSMSYGLGNTLTIYCLKRYRNLLPHVEICQSILDLLIEHFANPLLSVAGAGNVLEFIDIDNTGLSMDIDSNIKLKGKNDKVSKVEKPSIQKMIYLYLKNIIKSVLVRHIQGKLFIFFCEKLVQGNISNYQNYAYFFTVEELRKLITLFYRYNKIDLTDDVQYVMCYMLLEFIKDFGYNVHQNSPNSPINKRKMSVKRRSKEVKTDLLNKNYTTVVNNDSMDILLSILTSTHQVKNKMKNQLPTKNMPFELDSKKELYKICFNCCRRTDKLLIPCPQCGVVFFCSQKCNLIDKNTNSRHICKTMFYENSLLESQFSWIFGNANVKIPSPTNILTRNSNFRATMFALKNAEVTHAFVKPNDNLQKPGLQPASYQSIKPNNLVNSLRSLKDNMANTKRNKKHSTTKDNRLSYDKKNNIHSKAGYNTDKTKRNSKSTEELNNDKTDGINNDKSKSSFTKNVSKAQSIASSQYSSNTTSLHHLLERQRKFAAPKSNSSVYISKTKFSSEMLKRKRIRFHVSHNILNMDPRISKPQQNILKIRTSGVQLPKSQLKKITKLRKLSQKTKTSLSVGYKSSQRRIDQITPVMNLDFLNALTQLFPDFDFDTALAPFVCYSDSQFYYKFTEKKPEYFTTHM